MANIHEGHRERIRARFHQEGLSGFSEHEVLELLLTYAIPQRDVNPLAHALIAQFGSLSGVLEADEAELMRVEGVGPNAAMLLALMLPLLRAYRQSALGERPVILDLAGARRYCTSLFVGAHEESVYAICLDQSGRVLHPALLHTGTVDEVAMYPRVVVETALRYHAQSVLLAHNHPGGICEPSQADYDVTVTVVQALRLVGVRVIDHLIISGDQVCSMTRRSIPDTHTQEPLCYAVRSQCVPGRHGALKAGQEMEWIALDADMRP